MTTYAATDDLDIFAALAERDRAFAGLDATDYADETTAILKAIERVAAEGREFSANDVRPHLPECKSARVGRCFALAQERGWIEFVRLTKSSDKGTHGKRINVYRIAATS